MVRRKRVVAALVGMMSLVAGAALAAPTGMALAPSQSSFEILTPRAPAAPLTAAQREAVGRTLMSSELYVALLAGDTSGDGPVSVAARAVVLTDGSTAMAVFTSKEKLQSAFGDTAQVMALDGPSALAIYGLGALVIDYGASDEVVWSPEDTRAVLGAGG